MPTPSFHHLTTPIGNRRILVEASAGTGKTFALTGLVVRLVMEGVELKKIKTPTLILWGDRDFFPRSEQDSLVSALPNAVLKVYKDTGHALHWERPESFATDLKTFINSDLQAFAK